MATVKKKVFAACLYEFEGDRVSAFYVSPSEKSCTERATKMAKLLKARVVKVQDIIAGQKNGDSESLLDLDGCTLVAAVEDGGPTELLATVLKAKGNSYGGQKIKVGYSGDDETWFQPVGKKSKFKPGDKLILARFHANNPGGWTVVNEEITLAEYWQCGAEEDVEE